MGNLRRAYYDAFSKVYDKFVALHSSDTRGSLRRFLACQTPLEAGDRALDICTGTGALLTHLRERTGAGGLVAGVDFSRGMLEVAQRKTRRLGNIVLVESDVAFLPFKEDTFDAVTCSHAFYELKGDTQDRALREIRRVLKPGKAFLMMEHDVPENPVVKALFYMRFFSMGAGRALSILKHERALLERYFAQVEKTTTPAGRSKIWICRNRHS